MSDDPTNPRDPDKMLSDMRAALSEWTAAPRGSSAEHEACVKAADVADDLDTYLSVGGLLPKEWRGAIVPTLTEMARTGEVIVKPIDPDGTT